MTDQPGFDIRPMTDRAHFEGLLRLRWSEASMCNHIELEYEL